MRIANLDRINPELVREVQEIILTEIMASGATRAAWWAARWPWLKS